MKGYFSPLFFNRDRTISSSVQDVAFCGLAVAFLVSEPAHFYQ